METRINTSFTPGPWNAFRAQSSICVGANEQIQRVEDIEKSMYVEVFGENKEANARLIAASPMLLNAAQQALAALTPWRNFEEQEANIALQVAINQATG